MSTYKGEAATEANAVLRGGPAAEDGALVEVDDMTTNVMAGGVNYARTEQTEMHPSRGQLVVFRPRW